MDGDTIFAGFGRYIVAEVSLVWHFCVMKPLC